MNSFGLDVVNYNFKLKDDLFINILPSPAEIIDEALTDQIFFLCFLS